MMSLVRAQKASGSVQPPEATLRMTGWGSRLGFLATSQSRPHFLTSQSITCGRDHGGRPADGLLQPQGHHTETGAIRQLSHPLIRQEELTCQYPEL